MTLKPVNLFKVRTGIKNVVKMVRDREVIRDVRIYRSARLSRDNFLLAATIRKEE